MRKNLHRLMGALSGALLAATGAFAEDALPKNMTWTTLTTTSSGYAQSVAISNMLKQNHGVAVRVLPGKNDVSRMAPLRDGKAGFCICGGTVWMAQEGVHLFGKREWGPQPLRVSMTSFSGNSVLMMAATEASGIKTIADIKGKRVPYVKGAASVNWSTNALLAFGGLSWDDVVPVEVSGVTARLEAMLNGDADAIFNSSLSPLIQQLEASHLGLRWLPMPKNDTEGWARTQELAPYFVPVNGTSGAGMSKDTPIAGAAYPYPIMTMNADQDVGIVYALVKSMDENFDDFKDSAPGATGWAVENQVLQWAIPYHDGAIQYYNEIGVWTDEDQAYNDKLVHRQNVLQAAWKEFSSGAGDLSDEEFTAEWMKARKAALVAENLPVIFEPDATK